MDKSGWDKSDSVVDRCKDQNWFLISSPYLNYSLVVLYLIIVWKGQQLMESRRPLQLKNLMMFYNFAMVLLNGYMFIEFVAVHCFNPKFSLGCQAVDYSNDDKAVRLAAVCWWFYFSKLVEFADTFIFMLRKKNNQISFLHVYHHATMPMLWWVGVRWVAGEPDIKNEVVAFVVCTQKPNQSVHGKYNLVHQH
ncbi:putative elongation of very long chain fatty acids protein 4 isoform X1 [Apostichopus japonicus]|uniref:Elongation of very long chain fatty acids protein n=1 Tax=Stichopus japonicus TaxID=307972 RepID=A0A2G8JIF8_STIJA|nr:putative elongation of very long chain fatty acids protein 4 isoform X1 [Apostichopus japonicus]